jgi:hypothetical protein
MKELRRASERLEPKLVEKSMTNLRTGEKPVDVATLDGVADIPATAYHRGVDVGLVNYRSNGTQTGGVAMMSKHKPMVTWKSALALAGVLAGALLGLFVSSSSVEAAPTQSVYRDYYSNASLTNAVGARWVLQCNGPNNHQVWGRTSRYYRQSTTRCIGSARPVMLCYVDNVPVFCP